MVQTLPLVDLKEFQKGTPEQKEAFVQALGKAFAEIGFVGIRNHGIKEATISHVYEQAKELFALPENIKRKYEVPQGGYQRGYTAFGKEKAKGAEISDLKEFWHVGQEHIPAQDPVAKVYQKNVWPKEVPGCRQAFLEAYEEMQRTAQVILQAIALYLQQEQTFFEQKIALGNSVLRIIHYPPLTTEPQEALRAAEHEDINLITLLVGASAQGLQIKTKKETWMPITVTSDTIVVNISDMLSRWTNGKLRSTTHRVVNPPRAQWHLARYSIPFFVHPRPETDLSCLPSCMTKEKAQFAPITAHEFLFERLKENGLY